MSGERSLVRQAAAVAVREGRICLVSSRRGKRWVAPKGHIEAGQSAGETAQQEAWEEAGLIGRLDGQPLGRYRYHKNGRTYRVTVYLLRVAQVAEWWPERHRRRRRWLRWNRALEELGHPNLTRLLRRVLTQDRRIAEMSAGKRPAA